MRMVNFLLFAALALTTVFTGCKKDDDEVEVIETKPAIRTKVEYSSLTATTPYVNEFFVDEAGDSTVDRVTGMNRFQSFKGLNAMGASGTTTVLDASVLKNMYANKGNAFGGSYAFLNTSGVQLRNVTASSLSSTEAEVVRKKIESFLDSLAKASASNAEEAENGKAGILKNNGGSKYLVDGKGIEWNQIVQKGLIGAFQIDYIGNVLLNKGLSADNYSLVLGRNYTQLEHNWDEAFGVLTLNKVYGTGGNATTKPTSESFIGSYVWEYNKSGFEKMHLAFLKGRAAIINNDMATVRAQSDLIRKEMEYAIANAAVGYLKKWKDASATDSGAAAHALGEGAGFIYALRFCKMHNADAAFSDDLFNKIITSGHWNLTPTVAEEISSAIKAKFNIQ